MLGQRLRCVSLSHSNSFNGIRKFLSSTLLPTNLSYFPISISNFPPNRKFSISAPPHTVTSSIEPPLSGLEDDLVGYVLGRKKATQVAHLVWKNVLKKGDIAIDATCGNGYDTLALLKMVADEFCNGTLVYSFDIQRDALQNAASLLDENLTPSEREVVKLVSICHSRMEEIIPKDCPVRLVAFNLGYLPGGDKAITTVSETTLAALKAATRIVSPSGLVSLVVYVGHPGGREELDSVESFASGLPVDDWICCKFEMLNRPLAPVLVFLYKK